MNPTLRLLALAAAFALPSFAQHGHGHGHQQAHGASPYAGQQSRDIKALSEQEMRDLLSGAGIAKAAELNRYPGPMHALELADRLDLTTPQRQDLDALLQRHKARARVIGEQVVALERSLDALFARGKPNAVEVERLTAAIGAAQGRLRAEHLNTHLETTALLTPRQVEHYVKARGY
jgi:Spy/CpxP family protein refolding chaperone